MIRQEPKQLQPNEQGTAIFITVTNAIESLNAKLRRAIRARGYFPTDDSALKLLFLVLNLAARDGKYRLGNG